MKKGVFNILLMLMCGGMSVLADLGVEDVEGGYPRLLFSYSDIPALKQKVQTSWLRDAFAVMVARADSYLNISANPYSVSGASAGRAINERVNTLALTGILLDDMSYINHAIAICMSAVEQKDVNDFYGYNAHLSIADGLHAYAVAYDWLYNYMTPAERVALYDEVVEFMDWVYDDSINGGRGKYEPIPMSSNHNSVHHGALGLAAMVVSTECTAELKQAATFVEGYFKYARDATGYNSEGIGYYGYGSLGAIPFSKAYERAGYGNLIDAEQKNALISEYVLRFIQPWGGSIVALNDSPERLDVGSGMIEMIRRNKDRVGLWAWLKMFGPDGDGTYSGPDRSYVGMGCTLPYTLLFADEALEPLSPDAAGMSLGKFFDRGTGSFRSSWEDDAALATFTSGVDIHRGHNHRDEGSFTFSAFGEYFVVDAGYDPNMGRAHNCVTVNGVDQDKEVDDYDTYGLTLAAKEFSSAWYMKGDATASYPDALNLDHAIRQFMFVKAPQPYIIVSDDIESSDVADFSWLLHVAKDSDVTMGVSAGEFYIQGKGSAVCYVKFLTPTQGLTFEESDLSGIEFERLGATKQLDRYFRELSVNYTGVNPKYTAILIAAESMADLPDVQSELARDGLRVNVQFPNEEMEDQILIADGDMDFHRLGHVYYLQEDMTLDSSPNTPALWFDDPSGDSNLESLGGTIASNYFDLNGFMFRSPSVETPASFDGTFVVGNGEGAVDGLLYAADWSVAGFDVDHELLMQPQRETVHLSISNLVLRAAGSMQFGMLPDANDFVNLSIGHLTGNGALGFGVASSDHDSNGAWKMSITDSASEFSGTVSLVQGELTFDSPCVLSNATFEINEFDDNRIVLAYDVSFEAVEFGGSALEGGVYTATELNLALGTDRFSGGATLAVIPKPAVFYLQGSMIAGDSILDKEYWFDQPSSGAGMTENDTFSGNQFDVNRSYWRTPNTSGTAVFDGRLVVGRVGSGLIVHYAADLQLTEGMDVDRHVVVRPHRTAVSFTINDLKMGPSGELIFRTLAPDKNNQNLSVANLSGHGEIRFGTGAVDTNGVWSLSVSDMTPDFDGTVSLYTGELTFDNRFTLSDATFNMAVLQNNRVVLAHDVEFGRLKFGAITLTSGTYTADELNTVLGVERFSGLGSLTVNYMQNNFNAWMVEYELSGDDLLPSADPELDGMNNLLEYALGGNPNVDDATTVLPKHFIVDVDGIKWMDYVYQRRADAEARGLHYDVLVSTNLITGQWVNLGQQAEYNSISVGGAFESVTNRVPCDAPEQFITLKVSEE